MSFGSLRGKHNASLRQASLLTQAQSQARIRSQQKVLLQITSQIRQALQWNIISDTATKNTRHLLNADRVAVYCFSHSPSGDFQSESIHPSCAQHFGYFQNHQALSLKKVYLSSKTETVTSQYVAASQYTAIALSEQNLSQYSEPWVELLNTLEARACVLAPILNGPQLWGLLTVFQHAENRYWKLDEISLISQIADYLGIALQHAEQRTKIQAQSKELERLGREMEGLQTHAIQSEKMASLGQLVAGVAHEINNSVNFIHGNLKYVKEDMGSLLHLLQLYRSSYPTPTSAIQTVEDELDINFIQTDLPKQIDSMQAGSDRVRQIVLSLRNFSRKDETSLSTVDIHDCIDSTLVILQHRLKPTPKRPAIQVLRNYADLPPIECFCGQINQVFMNILVNAIDALDERTLQSIEYGMSPPPNRIIIQTKLIDPAQIKISIIDNGLGMKASVRERIFEPFFTTKDLGKGTGMGMSISHQVITEKHSGTLECYSKPDEGTEFVIHLPIQQTPLPTLEDLSPIAGHSVSS
jgi:signal transduction histidine kinase